MSFLKGKNVLLGVTASIAAYKAASLVRLLVKLGATVKVIQSPASKDFVTPLTLSTLSKNPVLTDFTKEENEDVWNNHVELGLWADLMIIAPTTAKTLSKMTSGDCDNLLLATYLSAKCPVFFAPAMDLDMFAHSSTQENIKKLQSYGNYLIPPGDGDLASGLSGKGRMAEPEEIIKSVIDKLYSNLPLKGKRVMVTAGPTYEMIDSVRFIGNLSSGKMGFSLANVAAQLGADVTLVSGPTRFDVENDKIKRIDIVSSDELFHACKKVAHQMDIVIMSAAVADFKIDEISKSKIKKDQGLNLKFVPTIDVLKSIAHEKKEHQIMVGFALENENELENANKKLVAKNLDLIILNSLRDKGAGFMTDTNKISIIENGNKVTNFKLKSKNDVAYDIFNHILKMIS